MNICNYPNACAVGICAALLLRCDLAAAPFRQNADTVLTEISDTDCHAQNLLANGDFESGIQGFWAPFNPNTIFWDNMEARFGKGSLCINLEDGPQHVKDAKHHTLYADFMPLRADRFYYLSVWMKSSSPVTVEIWLCENKALTGFWRRSVHVTTEWRQYEAIIELPSKAAAEKDMYYRDWHGGKRKYFGDSFAGRLAMRVPDGTRAGKLWLDQLKFIMIGLP